MTTPNHDEIPRLSSDGQFKYTGQGRYLIPPNIIILAIDFFVERVEEAAFANQAELQTAFVPSTVRHIERNAFTNCISLNDLELGEGLQTIGTMAFARCQSLKEVSIPSTVELIGDNAFMNCIALVKLTFDMDGRLNRICEYAFRKCEALPTVAIPPSVQRIEEFAFDGCTALVELSLSVGLQHIGRNAFSMCVSLQLVDIPSTVTAIGVGSFANCKSLVVVNLQTGLEEIRDNAFEGCCSLQTVSVPDTVWWIGGRAFSFCIALVSVEIPANIGTGFGEGVFLMCKNLVNISLPIDSSEIEEDAFGGCTLLKQKYAGRRITEELKKRFEGYPIHNLCYHASTTNIDELIAKIEAEGDVVDDIGMTPFHLLASGKQPVDLFRKLIDYYPKELLVCKDHFGNSPLGYLCVHISQQVHALFQTIVQTSILDPANHLDHRPWHLEVLDLANPLQDSLEEWTTVSYADRRKCVEEAYSKLDRYTRVQKSSLLELALWKASMDCPTMDRAGSRITCGASIAIPQVTKFLGYSSFAS